MKRTLAACALALAAMAGCGADDTQPRSLGTVPQKADPSTTTTTKPADYQFTVGEKVLTARGNTVTVYSYAQPVPPPDEYSAAPDGMEVAAADVEICVTADLSNYDGQVVPPEQRFLTSNPYDWVLAMPDNSRLQPSHARSEPALNAADIAEGQCVRGWVSWEVPAGVRPRAVVNTATGPPNLEWTT